MMSTWIAPLHCQVIMGSTRSPINKSWWQIDGSALSKAQLNLLYFSLTQKATAFLHFDSFCVPTWALEILVYCSKVYLKATSLSEKNRRPHNLIDKACVNALFLLCGLRRRVCFGRNWCSVGRLEHLKITVKWPELTDAALGDREKKLAS